MASAYFDRITDKELLRVLNDFLETNRFERFGKNDRMENSMFVSMIFGPSIYDLSSQLILPGIEN